MDGMRPAQYQRFSDLLRTRTLWPPWLGKSICCDVGLGTGARPRRARCLPRARLPLARGVTPFRSWPLDDSPLRLYFVACGSMDGSAPVGPKLLLRGTTCHFSSSHSVRPFLASLQAPIVPLRHNTRMERNHICHRARRTVALVHETSDAILESARAPQSPGGCQVGYGRQLKEDPWSTKTRSTL